MIRKRSTLERTESITELLNKEQRSESVSEPSDNVKADLVRISLDSVL